MAEAGAQLDELDPGLAGSGGAVEPSAGNALPYFISLLVFPLLTAAALYGGWWIAGPFVFLSLPNMFDGIFGRNTRNMDLEQVRERQLLPYDLALWAWALCWPATLLFGLWQILVVGHLSFWENVLVALALTGVASQTVFVVAHELAHRATAWERGLGELLMLSVGYPYYSLEHLYGHHANVCTPADPSSALKGLTLWRYLPRDLVRGYRNTWHHARIRLERCHLPAWHYTNPFWRYLATGITWLGLIYWMGGIWALLIYVYLCATIVVVVKTVNYVQHYGLLRLREPGGWFEPVRTWHSWNEATRFSNWLFFNTQRHPDHHIEASRHYPLLQYYSGSEAPQLPGGYVQMVLLAMSPRHWFRTIDPLVDRWRAHFYPQVEDWSAYDSRAFAARPDAFEAIEEILGTAPRIGAWINRSPALLDNLRAKEFANLELPDGFGPNPETEARVRRGLARLYWMHEFGVPEMRERIADFPIHSPRDAVEAARHWSNDQVFQVCMHAMRGTLTPADAGTALANVAEASIAAVLAVTEEMFAKRHSRRDAGSIAAVMLGDLASGEAAPGAALDVVFVREGGSAEYCEALGRRFHEELRALSRDSLLFAPASRRHSDKQAVHALDGFAAYHQTDGSTRELLDLTRVRGVFASGAAGLAERLDGARREALSHGAVRDALLAELRTAPKPASESPEPGLPSVRDMRGGPRDVARAARFLQVAHAGEVPDLLACDAVAVFTAAGTQGVGPEGVAERLAEAARMWRNLQGITRLLAGADFNTDTATLRTKAVIAQACGAEDFDALGDAVRETAVRAAADIEALTV